MFKNFLKNIALAIFSLFIFSLALEIVLRLTNQLPSYYYPKGLYIPDNILGYRLKPNFEATQDLGEYAYKIKINSDGLRDNEHGEKKYFRILGLGDSFTFGTGLELEQTYLGVLENLINSSGKLRCEVIKAGVPGYGTDQELGYLKLFGLKHKPDLVLLGFCIPNDPDDNLRDNDIVINGFLVSPDARKYDRNIFFDIKAFCRKNIYIYSFVVNRFKNSPKLQKFIFKSGLGINIFEKELQFYRHDYSKETEDSWRVTFSILQDIKSLTDKMDIKLYLILIPTRIQVDKKYLALVKSKLGLEDNDCNTSKPTEILSSFCKEKRINFLDLTSSLSKVVDRGEQLYYILDGHWNRDGARLAAQVIFQYLIQDI